MPESVYQFSLGPTSGILFDGRGVRSTGCETRGRVTKKKVQRQYKASDSRLAACLEKMEDRTACITCVDSCDGDTCVCTFCRVSAEL